MHKGESMSFRLFASVKEIESLHGTELDHQVPRRRQHITHHREVALSDCFRYQSSGVRFFTEIAHFKAIGMDVDRSPEQAEDSFTLTSSTARRA